MANSATQHAMSKKETSVRLSQQKADAIEQVVAAGKRSLDFIAAETSCGTECWPVLVHFFHASQWQSIQVSRSTYEEIRPQGLPRSRDIVDALEGYLAQNGPLSVTNLLPAYRSSVRQLIPLDVQANYWEHCYQLDDGAETYVLDCPKGVSDEIAERAVGKIVDSPDIERFLTEWAGLNTATPSDLAEQIKAAERALAVINEEIEGRT